MPVVRFESLTWEEQTKLGDEAYGNGEELEETEEMIDEHADVTYSCGLVT